MEARKLFFFFLGNSAFIYRNKHKLQRKTQDKLAKGNLPTTATKQTNHKTKASQNRWQRKTH